MTFFTNNITHFTEKQQVLPNLARLVNGMAHKITWTLGYGVPVCACRMQATKEQTQAEVLPNEGGLSG